MKKTIASLVAIALISLGVFFIGGMEGNSVYVNSFTDSIRETITSVFFTDSITARKLKDDFSKVSIGGRKLKIMIVPGHDDSTVGAQFGYVRESDLNAKLGEKILRLLETRKEFSPVLTRSVVGYNPSFSEYLVNNKQDIDSFVISKKAEMNSLVNSGLVDSYSGVIHNVAPKKAIFSLYGANKWANDDNVDIVLHIHFNDYPRKNIRSPGKYNGFTIYVPEGQYSNSKASRAVSTSVFSSIARFYPVSNLMKEREGIVEDQDLIAVGAFNTLDSVGFLVEYGYIYESILQNTNIQNETLEDLAWLTYEGVSAFFDENYIHVTSPKISGYRIGKYLEKGLDDDIDVWYTQAKLREIGMYPPKGVDIRDCPVNGSFGPCTESSVRLFQSEQGVYPTGVVDFATRLALNSLF